MAKVENLEWNKLGRIAVFIDAANVIYSCKSLGWHIKYERLRNYFKSHGKLVGISFYYAEREENIHDTKLFGALTNLGFFVRSRRVKIFKNADGTIQVKGNVDGELIVDMIKSKDDYDTAFLLSGDSDFSYAADFLKTSGKKVFVVSTRNHVSRELIRASSGYFNLRDFKDDWSFL